MTIDHTDYAARPADDYLALYPPGTKAPKPDDYQRAYSIIIGRRKREPECHQLGCPFARLPHAQP